MSVCVWDSVWGGVWGGVWGSVWGGVWGSVWDGVWGGVWEHTCTCMHVFYFMVDGSVEGTFGSPGHLFPITFTLLLPRSAACTVHMEMKVSLCTNAYNNSTSCVVL